MCWFFGIGCRWGPGKGAGLDPGGGRGGRAPGVEHRALDAGVGRRGWARGWAPGFGPGAGERVGRPKRRPGQLGGRTVGWAAGRPNGRVKEWKKMVMVKVPARPGLDPSRVRSDNPSGQPKGPSRVRSARASARRSSSPRESHPVKVRPARVSACQGFVRSPSPGQPKGRSIKVPAHPGLGPSKVRSARASARRSSSPGGSPHPSTSGSPPHLFPFPPPSCPPPLLYRSGASYPSDAPPLHPAFRCG